MPPKEKPPKPLRSLATSALTRGFRASLAGAGAAARLGGGALQKLVASSEAAQAIDLRTRAALANRLKEELGQMKGLAMKAGQVASYMDFALPSGARAILAELQDHSTGMAPDIAARVVLEDLGAPPSALFAEWDESPFAAASIGQVHRARLADGREVAVKVQYPGIDRAISADLKNASAVDLLSGLVFRGQERGTVLRELSDRLNEECDYRLEATNQEEFRRLFASRPDVRVPAVVPERSARRVLTSELVHGRRFADFAREATQEEKNRAGEAIWDVAMGSIFTHGMFNADPHPGNYLFEPSRVVFLDFGCVKRFTEEMIERWRRLTLAGIRGDRPVFDRMITELGFAPDPKTYDFDYHYAMTRVIYEPWSHDRVYRFEPELVERTWKALVLDNPNKFRMNLPPDFLFVNRIQWGLFAVLAALGAESNWHRRYLPLLEAGRVASVG
ncbi:MAG: ABC1 kinase family protein [Deltaproteobacteria bacterium]